MSATADWVEVEPDLWRALGSPHRRRLLDLLSAGPATTGRLAEAIPELSRFAVMQHLGVLTEAGLVLVERRGRERLNYLNAVPLREWYERWVRPIADGAASELLAVRRYAEQGDPPMTTTEQIRTVRLACELRIRASAERTFEAMTQRTLEWFPHTYGEERVRRIVLERRVGGNHYEDWGDGAGHLYGVVTAYDPPHGWSTRGRLSPGTTLDTEYVIEEDGDGVVLRMTKVATGPMTEEEASSISRYGDISGFADAIQRVAES